MSRNLSQAEWLRKREKALERDNRECQQCGKGEEEAEVLHVHHNLPVKAGGGHEIENLRTLCKSCHYEFHAEERRNGTLEDIKDIFLRAEAPAFKRFHIERRLGCSESQARKKLDKLVEDGFLEKVDPGAYCRSDLPIEHANSVDGKRIVVDGSVVMDGEYIGDEESVRQCEVCDKYIHAEFPDNALQSHKSYHH